MLLSKPVPILGKALVSLALCFATAPAYANAACQGQGCVLPIADAPPPAVSEAPVEVVEESGGLFGGGLFPILLGVAAIALAALILLNNDDDEDVPVSP